MRPRRKTNGKINQSRKTSNKRIKLYGRMIGRLIDYALYRLNIVNNDSDHLLHV